MSSSLLSCVTWRGMKISADSCKLKKAAGGSQGAERETTRLNSGRNGAWEKLPAGGSDKTTIC